MHGLVSAKCMPQSACRKCLLCGDIFTFGSWKQTNKTNKNPFFFFFFFCRGEINFCSLAFPQQAKLKANLQQQKETRGLRTTHLHLQNVCRLTTKQNKTKRRCSCIAVLCRCIFAGRLGFVVRWKRVVCGHCRLTLSLTLDETLKWLSSLPILMQKSFWRWQCSSVRYSTSPPQPFILFLFFLFLWRVWGGGGGGGVVLKHYLA